MSALKTNKVTMTNSGLFFMLTMSCLFLSCSQRSGEKPEDNRFSVEVLADNLSEADNLDEPMQFKFMGDGRIIFAERKGKIKVFDPETGSMKVIADIPVSVGYYSPTGEVNSTTGEDGLQGVILDPGFEHNRFVYVYYSPRGGVHRSLLSRYEWPENGTLNIQSEKILLEVPNQRESCCHLGGGMVFDKQGNLYLSTGDNTPNDPRGFSPMDERPGRARFDAQRSSANTNDLRGKILRIHPEDDGSYSIPQGNLFPEGTPNTRPEIYTMGNRNPWRLSLDSETGWLYWGEVGPGGTKDVEGMGPRSYDEFNMAKRAGNYGWPYFSANNQAYWKYNYETKESLTPFDSLKPVNASPNNTGITDLPPAVPALIWYPQSKAIDFPLMGSGSNSAVGGPIFRAVDFKNGKRPFPPYYEGKWFITDWTRGWIMAVSFHEDGSFRDMEHFLPDLTLEGPIDLQFGPDGDLYVLEYGRGTYKRNGNARLSRIKYNKGNRAPVVELSADKTVGAVPLQIQLSSAGSLDYDQDKLRYEWNVTVNGRTVQKFDEANPVLTIDDEGQYEVTLTVADTKGASNSESLQIIAGNEIPNVSFAFHGANQSFYFTDRTIEYAVSVNDKEDGSLADRGIDSSQVHVSIDFLSIGEDFNQIAKKLKDMDPEMPLKSVLAGQLIASSDCQSCHTEGARLLGPSYIEISEKYKGIMGARKHLTDKVIFGGNGAWGETMMPAHPSLSREDANTIVDYILSINETAGQKSRPIGGSYYVQADKDHDSNGKLIFKASYTDKGTPRAPRQRGTALVILRNPMVPVAQTDLSHGVEWNHQINPDFSSVILKDYGSYLGMRRIDLTAIRQVQFIVSDRYLQGDHPNAVVEIRLDSPEGKCIGTTADLIQLQNGVDRKKISLNADIPDLMGLHDVYFVMTGKNKQTEPTALEIRQIKFISTP